MTGVTNKAYALNALQDRVHDVARVSNPSESDLFRLSISRSPLSKSLNHLAEYFTGKRDFRLKDRNRQGYNNWEPAEVKHGDFLVDIVNSMMIAGISEDEFSSCGRGLIDLMGEIYVNRDDPGYFGGFVLPKLAEKEFAKTGSSLIKSAEVANKLRNGRSDLNKKKSGRVFFPILSNALSYADITSLSQLHGFSPGSKNYEKHLAKMKQASPGL